MTKLPTKSALIATTENELINTLSNALISDNFSITQAFSGDQCINLAKSNQYNAIVIDSLLPDIPGIFVCAIIRSKKINKSTPIIIIGEKESGFNLIKGAEFGIDDYLLRPIVVKDLIIIIKNLTKRTNPILHNSFLQYQDLKIDISSYRVTRGTREIHLGPTEFKILRCLMEFPRRILSREYLLVNVWGNADNIEPRTIDVHINRLRTALKNNSEDRSVIRTIRALGYCLDTPIQNQNLSV